MRTENHPQDPAFNIPASNAGERTAILAAVDEMDRFDMYELGELYVAIVCHAVAAKSTDPLATAKLDEAVDAFLGVTNAGDEEDLRNVLAGINQALYDAAEGRLTWLA
jgi:hypothetical protein